MKCAPSTEPASRGDAQAPFNRPFSQRPRQHRPSVVTTLMESLGKLEFNLFCAELFLMGQFYKERALSAFPEGESVPISPTSSSSEINESFGVFIDIRTFSASHPKTRAAVSRIRVPR